VVCRDRRINGQATGFIVAVGVQYPTASSDLLPVGEQQLPAGWPPPSAEVLDPRLQSSQRSGNGLRLQRGRSGLHRSRSSSWQSATICMRMPSLSAKGGRHSEREALGSVVEGQQQGSTWFPAQRPRRDHGDEGRIDPAVEAQQEPLEATIAA